MDSRIIPVPLGAPTFLDMPRGDDLDRLDADVAIIGLQHAFPYDMAGSTQPSFAAPAAIRAQSQRWAPFLTHYDVDFGSDLFAGREVRIVDCGDIALRPGHYAANSAAATAVIAAILDRGAVPFVLGGDDSVPIPALRAYDGREPFVVVQIDQHLDWRDERHGVREGLSSPMRRASEMPWVAGMAQIGLRGVGSARRQDVDDATAYGSVLIRAADVHDRGIDAALAMIPRADRYYITFDADALDGSLAPGVLAPSFGGLDYDETSRLLRGVARMGRIVGYDVVEIVPHLDVANATSRVCARLTLDLIAAMAHAGQIGRPRGA